MFEGSPARGEDYGLGRKRGFATSAVIWVTTFHNWMTPMMGGEVQSVTLDLGIWISRSMRSRLDRWTRFSPGVLELTARRRQSREFLIGLFSKARKEIYSTGRALGRAAAHYMG